MKSLNVHLTGMKIGHSAGKMVFGAFEGEGEYGGWDSRGGPHSGEHAGVKASPRAMKAGGS